MGHYPFNRRPLFGRIRIIYAGDDTTDEDAITALKGMAYSFRVASSHLTQTAADKRLPNTDSVLTLLHWVEKHMSERKLKVHINKLARRSSPTQVHSTPYRVGTGHCTVGTGNERLQ